MSEGDEERKFQFLRNGDAEPSDLDWSKGVESARQAISEAMSAKNVAFLLGAGCSSLVKDGKELGISTMAPLAKEFCGETLDARKAGFYTETSPTEGSEHGAIADDNAAAGDTAAETIAGPFADLLGETAVVDGATGVSVAQIADEPERTPAPWRLTKTELDYLDVLGINLEKDYSRNLERLMEVLFAQRFVLRHSPAVRELFGHQRQGDGRGSSGAR